MRFTAILRSVAVLYTEHVAKVMKPMEKEQCEKSIQHHSAKFNLENKRGATRATVKSTRTTLSSSISVLPFAIVVSAISRKADQRFAMLGKDTIQEKETLNTGRLCSRTRTGYTSLRTMFIPTNELLAASWEDLGLHRAMGLQQYHPRRAKDGELRISTEYKR
ncbi:hypothetical protein LTR10_011162 [Elasticomyces elasticus]|nr:hypothetical protein LTR10_011162 [Elasticomyces elasticus]